MERKEHGDKMWTKIYRELFWMGFSKEQYEQVKGPMHYLERLEKISSGKGISISYVQKIMVKPTKP